MQAFFIGINSKYIHTALGIRCVTEYCRERGLSARSLEATVNEPVLSVLTRITEQLEASGIVAGTPVLIGLDVHIWNRKFVLELGALLRKVVPDSLLLLGGPEVMFNPKETLASVAFADFIVCGEGEEAVAALLQNLTRYGKTCPVPRGIAYRDANDVVAGDGGPLVVEDLDTLPFPYPDLEQVVAQHKIVYYEASRGCPFHCAYCLSGISRSVRRRSLSRVLADMDRFIQAGATLIKFVDRTYNLDESYYLPMMQYLAKVDTGAVFHFEIKADLLSPRVIDFLKTVPKGRFQLEIGVQSTNSEVLKEIGRGDDWEKLKANVTELRQAGNMHIHADLIAGLPLEDMKSFARSFDDVYGLHPHVLQLGFLKVLPGTLMDRAALKYGLVYMDQPPYEILSTNYISYKEVRFLKTLEEVFNLTANSGRFSFSLAYLVRMAGQGSAFSFFAGLTEWYRKKGLAGFGHSGTEVARILFDFVREAYPDLLATVRELLRLDVLQNFPNVKPDWLAWRNEKNYETVSGFWRNEEAVRKYLPGYTFKNWRELHKKYALEELLCDPWTGEKESVFLLINYEEMCLTRIERSAIITKPSVDGMEP